MGGMRFPLEAARRVPKSFEAGRRVRRALTKVLAKFSGLSIQLEGLVRGDKVDDLPAAAVMEARTEIAREFGVTIPGTLPAGMCPHMLRLWQRESADPDVAVPRWAEEGAPLGISRDIERCGIFPPVYESAPVDAETSRRAAFDWGNYQSAEDNPQVCHDILRGMVSKGWATECPTWDALVQAVGSDTPRISKMALISKPRRDGSIKHRIIWDLRRSWVNECIRQAERILLPRPTDFVQALLELWRLAPADGLVLFGCDVESAFHQVPVHPSEWKHAVTYLGGSYFVFKVLVFGAASAPTVWGRVAALIARSTAAIVPQDEVRLAVYVDDPVFGARGPASRAAASFGLAVLWIMCLGFPLSVAKLEGGHSLSWIGVQYVVLPAAVRLTVPQDKVEELSAFTGDIADKAVVSLTTVRRFAGKLAFVAGVIPQLRPVLWPLWAVLSRAEGVEGDAAASSALVSSSDRRPVGREQDFFIHVRRIRRCLAWLAQFWQRRLGTIVRDYPLVTPQPSHTISTDASPWGIGGILQEASGVVVSYFFDALTGDDASQLQAKIGEPASQTTWELLAVVVALRCWSPRLQHAGVFRLRSDSMAALSALFRNASPAGPLNELLLMLSLHNSELVGGVRWLEHVPGVANVLPDRLSRIHAPGGEQLPPELAAVERVQVERDRAFWLL